VPKRPAELDLMARIAGMRLVHGPGRKVEVAPGEAQDLPLAQATGEGDEIECLEPITLGRAEEDPRLLRVEWSDLARRDPRRAAMRPTLRPTSSVRSACPRAWRSTLRR
jgi:hypothetical protein